MPFQPYSAHAFHPKENTLTHRPMHAILHRPLGLVPLRMTQALTRMRLLDTRMRRRQGLQVDLVRVHQ